MTTRVPIRLLVHFQIARRPLVQITEGIETDGRVRGAGTRAINTANGDDEIELFDPATGEPTNERVTIDRALAILYSLSKR